MAKFRLKDPKGSFFEPLSGTTFSGNKPFELEETPQIKKAVKDGVLLRSTEPGEPVKAPKKQRKDLEKPIS